MPLLFCALELVAFLLSIYCSTSRRHYSQNNENMRCYSDPEGASPGHSNIQFLNSTPNNLNYNFLQTIAPFSPLSCNLKALRSLSPQCDAVSHTESRSIHVFVSMPFSVYADATTALHLDSDMRSVTALSPFDFLPSTLDYRPILVPFISYLAF